MCNRSELPPPELLAEAADLATPADRLVELAQHPQLTPIVAANPAAPAELLREIEARIVDTLPMPISAAIALMTHGTPTVTYQHYRDLGLRADNPTLAALVANPNTPTDTLLRLRMRAPFFATLALFARVEPTAEVAAAATDGWTVFVNPDHLRSLAPPQQDELLLHEVLHAALLHVPRRGSRSPQLWNLASDIVVNGLIAAIEGVQLPADAVRDPRRENLSVEEVYELLLHDPAPPSLARLDLLDRPGGHADAGGAESDSIATGRQAAMEAHWRDAHQHAGIIALSVAQGKMPAGLARELGMLNPARLDWQAHLWRYIAQTPTDFQDFDRRFIGRGLYLEALASESVRVFVAVDTSGSVDFRPFFAAVAERYDPHEQSVCVYLTDGYGDFPAEPPDIPVLWVVTAGGKALDGFPFGEAVRLLESYELSVESYELDCTVTLSSCHKFAPR